jgi:ketosteroid isomerase-like protein
VTSQDQASTQIHALYEEYGEHFEAGDSLAFASLFSETATIFRPDGSAVSGREQLVAMVEGAKARGARVRHFLADIDIETEGDSARGAAHVVALSSSAEDDLSLLMMGRYSDRFTRIDGVWKFESRKIATLGPAPLDETPVLLT